MIARVRMFMDLAWMVKSSNGILHTLQVRLRNNHFFIIRFYRYPYLYTTLYINTYFLAQARDARLFTI